MPEALCGHARVCSIINQLTTKSADGVEVGGDSEKISARDHCFLDFGDNGFPCQYLKVMGCSCPGALLYSRERCQDLKMMVSSEDGIGARRSHA